MASHTSGKWSLFMTTFFYLKKHSTFLTVSVHTAHDILTFIWFTYLNVSKAHYIKYCQILFTLNFCEIKKVRADYM